MTKAQQTGEWPAGAVELRDLDTLKPYKRNPRTHSKAQVALLAKSIERWGWTIPVLVDERGEIIAGHGRIEAARLLGIASVPCMVARGWTDAERRAYVIADNQLTIAGGWNTQTLSLELRELAGLKVDLDGLGFSSKTLDNLLGTDEARRRELEAAEDLAPDADGARRSKLGSLWQLGEHRVLCGDSTDPAAVLRVMGDEIADLVHADPPYGMGKEADGIANDNLYRGKLDAFQLSWITAALPSMRENASLYIWGLAPDLWRLWYGAGLDKLDAFVLRNEVVWAKGSGNGQTSAAQQSYVPETERCLFLQRGPQVLESMNADEFWEGYEPLRAWLCEQRDAVRWTARDIHRLTGTQMSPRWFSRSQFAPIARQHYETLRDAALGCAFDLTYDELQARFDTGGAMRRQRAEELRERRSFFDNTHDNMTDVWRFNRVTGAERYGHATPKPVALAARAVASSCPANGLVFEPFLGTGSTLIAAEITGRRCNGVELEPQFVDIVVRRWERHTGRKARLLA